MSGGEGQGHGPFPVKGLNVTINLTNQKPLPFTIPSINFLFVCFLAMLLAYRILVPYQRSNPLPLQ